MRIIDKTLSDKVAKTASEYAGRASCRTKCLERDWGETLKLRYTDFEKKTRRLEVYAQCCTKLKFLCGYVIVLLYPQVTKP